MPDLRYRKRPWQKMERTSRWKGGKIKRGNYIYVKMPEYHRADHRGYVPEHVLNYELYHGCCVLPWGDIHHINNIKTDNDPDNLLGMTHIQHLFITNTEREQKLSSGRPICHDRKMWKIGRDKRRGRNTQKWMCRVCRRFRTVDM